MNNNEKISLVTPSWAGDLEQFRLLRASLDRSPLAEIPHTVVVQTEDKDLFSGFDSQALELKTTSEVLPSEVESRRIAARHTSRLLGRHLTRVCGSTRRALGWPSWPAYTGWHTQQISKLALAAQAQSDYVLVLDSDVIVTRSADLSGLMSEPDIVCFSEPKPLEQFRGKARKWVLQADQLLQVGAPAGGVYDCYFDTPFLLHSPSVRVMLDWLEKQYQKPWWQALLNQPPRRWSEFAIYKRFLQTLSSDADKSSVKWLPPEHMHYIFDASDTDRLMAELRSCLTDPNTHFITVHSQSSGRGLWSTADFASKVMPIL